LFDSVFLYAFNLMQVVVEASINEVVLAGVGFLALASRA
jgi:hypothetical protein